MKKNLLIIIVIIALAAIAIYLHYTTGSSSISEENRGFSIDDTSSVTMIFLADKAGKSVTLKRSETGSWTANDQFTARADLMDILLQTMKTLEIYSPVSKSAHENVIKQLSNMGIKCEIYFNKNDEPEKVYYVGGATQDQNGTYMLMEGSLTPFIITVPYFSGYLTPRYSTDIYEWRDKMMFNFRFADISYLKVVHQNNPSSSFEITNIGSWTYLLRSLQSGKTSLGYDTTALRIYLTNFQNVYFEEFISRAKPEFVDSVISQNPVYIITVKDNMGKITTLTTFRKGLPEGTLDMSGNPVYDDVDRMYATVSGYDELVTVQYYVLDNLLRKLQDFSPEFGNKQINKVSLQP